MSLPWSAIQGALRALLELSRAMDGFRSSKDLKSLGLLKGPRKLAAQTLRSASVRPSEALWCPGWPEGPWCCSQAV